MSLLNSVPTRHTHHWYAPYEPAHKRILTIIDTRLIPLRVFTLTHKHLTHLFCVLGCVAAIVMLKNQNPRKATGPDFIPLKVMNFALNVIDSHLYNKNKRPRKRSVIRRAKNERNRIANYRLVSILNGMSKSYERLIHYSLSSYAETI